MAPATRERILDAALRAFASRGVDGTAITDLEQDAGLAAGSGGFYRYFRTKDEALAAVVRREIDRVVEAQGHASSDGEVTDPRDRVAAMVDDGLSLVRSLSPLMAILSREQGRIPDLAAEVSTRLVEGGLRADASRLAATAEGVDGDEARALMAVVTSAIVGYTLASDYFGAPPGGVRRDEFRDALADLLAPRVARRTLAGKEGSL